MKVPLSWLKDFIEPPTEDPEEIEQALVSLGHEVESIEHIYPSFDGVVVGRVVEVGPHPNADKIRLCKVDDGSDVLEVVCGAWNFEAGAVIAYARVGSRLALDSDEPFEIGARELRGVVSNGMIASARELGLGDEHDGILVLDRMGAATAEDVGRPFDEVIGLSDVVLDVSITPNRGDCMSVRGVARELAAYWDIAWTDVEPAVDPSDLEPSIAIEILDPEACPRFVGHEVDGVTLGPSPLWMQLRLLSIGQRPISNVVDVSNYVMFELGHPIHTFDADTVQGKEISVRLARPGETLTTLDGSRRQLDTGDIVVTDSTGPVALAGVMGGESTEVSDDTVNILVEAAHWRPHSILHTSHRLGLRSEASARFERGVDPNLSDRAAARAAQLIVATGGGSARARQVDVYPAPVRPRTISLTERDIARTLGADVSFVLACALLERLAFGVEIEADQAEVTVPSYRPDIARPVDLLEEVARLHGYDNFADRVRIGNDGSRTSEQRSLRRVREVLVGAGLCEAHTLSFIGQSDLDTLGLADTDHRRVGIKVKNPLRDEESTMRTTLLAGLLAAAVHNVARAIPDVRLFETGRVFLPEPDRTDPRIPNQPMTLGVVMVGDGVDVFEATGVIDLVARSAGLRVEIAQTSLPVLHPGRGGRLSVDGAVVGFVGELHPAVARDVGLEGRIAVAELDLAPLIQADAEWILEDVSVFPPHVFDLAFVLDAEIPAVRAHQVIAEAAGVHLESLALFDEFRGPAIPAGSRSLAFRVTLRSLDSTLSDEDVKPVRDSIVEAVSSQLGGQLRGGT